MKSRLLNIRNEHHIEESQLEQMLTRHDSRVHDHVSFLVSPPCFSTNFMSMANLELASTADEAQGSTSRLAVGTGAVASPAPKNSGDSSSGLERRVSTPDVAGSSPAPLSISGPCAQFIGGVRCEKGAETGDYPANRSDSRTAPSDFSILSRPHIVRSKEEVHVELCHECERMASGHCECGLAVCSAHRYSSDGERNPHGMCGKCQKEVSGDVEIFNSCGRAQQ